MANLICNQLRFGFKLHSTRVYVYRPLPLASSPFPFSASNLSVKLRHCAIANDRKSLIKSKDVYWLVTSVASSGFSVIAVPCRQYYMGGNWKSSVTAYLFLTHSNMFLFNNCSITSIRICLPPLILYTLV